MSENDNQALKYIRKKYACKTAIELYRVMEKLAKTAREESRKEASGNYKSEFSAETPFEAEQLLKK